MKHKGKINRIASIFLVVLIFAFNISVGAAEKTARLRDCLEKDHLYLVLPVDYLGEMVNKYSSTFKSNFDDRYLAFTGIIRYSSVSSNHKSVTVYGSEYGIKVDTSNSSVMTSVGQLKLGDSVTVYGQVDGTEIDAEYLVINPEKELSTLDYVFYPDKTYDEKMITDLASDGHVTFSVPAEWDNEYVMGRLTNNNVNGYQFFLNALSPQNLNFPENFYIFYFNYETYLDKVKKNPDSYDVHDIEELIIKNILQNLSDDFKPDVATLKLSDGKSFDYCPLVYRPADGNDYRLEFIFKSDPTGIICMLYLYYPNDSAVNHVRDVAYVLNNIK